ncbi:chromosome transmission fidelity protein 8 homolog isoform X1 [Portunus trituberculatus]|uniref:chromosome transmission fidelity protein 8 homolog isoform X1 n=2 Tax=Portunus trituberculatus TaxID=210409 RepID=UPI001E1CBC31|nr:chromosome transmission fidelity protein 8 homolog isoform X1 [Portunus trituberculatus]
MQIPVQVSKDGLKEWMILELQGELKCLPHITMGGRPLGDLHFNKQGVPVLLIGHHILHGAVQDLPKPVAVMRKVGADREGSEAHYLISAVVHKKVIFKNRPKPIVNAGVPRLV